MSTTIRHDGWTLDRQIGFLRALLHVRCVARAARRVGMSRESAYRLRRRPAAAQFAAAWDRILAAPPSSIGKPGHEGHAPARPSRADRAHPVGLPPREGHERHAVHRNAPRGQPGQAR